MNSFEWIDARSVDEAAHLLSTGSDIVAKAGGIDLMDLMKEGLLSPTRVINLRTIEGLGEVERDAQGSLRIGALVTLAQLASDAKVLEQFGALAAAAQHAATPQVRNAATLGGNLLQRPRCWYFRSGNFERAEVINAARNGANQYHGIFDTSSSPLVHASTPATALLAYDATVHVATTQGSRSISLRDFFLAPDPTRTMDVSMKPGEVLTHISLPPQAKGTSSAYLKQTERDSYDWPICDVAVVLQFAANGTIASAAIALGSVAPMPMRAREGEALLIGRTVDEALAQHVAQTIVRSAKPLSRNAYKVQVLETGIRRTLMEASQ